MATREAPPVRLGSTSGWGATGHVEPDQLNAAWQALQQHDLPTHGGRKLSYVYDSGVAGADALGRGRR